MLKYPELAILYRESVPFETVLSVYLKLFKFKNNYNNVVETLKILKEKGILTNEDIIYIKNKMLQLLKNRFINYELYDHLGRVIHYDIKSEN